MKTYAIFLNDCEIHVALTEGDLSNIPSIRDEITEQRKADKLLEHGFVEQYPFYQAEWELVGYAIPVGFDESTILEVNQ
jgi:hypothetical protein